MKQIKINKKDKISVYNRGILYYNGAEEDFKLHFSQIGWSTSLPKGYDDDDLNWFVIERVLTSECKGVDSKNSYTLNSYKYDTNDELIAEDNLKVILWK
jgi:hypothetical protein